MTYLTKLTLSFTGLLLVALISASLAFWSARVAQHHLERMGMAHQVHQHYLTLSSNSYELFKQFGDAFLIGDRDQGAGEAILLAAIREDITQLRHLIAEEVRIVGEEEVVELDLLAAIERQLGLLLMEFARLSELRAVDPRTYRARLSRMLDESADGTFQALLTEALNEEKEEVLEAERSMRLAVRKFQTAAVAAGGIAALTALIGLLLLRRALIRPIERLVEGAEAVGGGQLGHRIESSGTRELDQVAAAFNVMAGRVAQRQDLLSASHHALEREVAKRTAQLEGLLTNLREAEANRRRLLADVSHELRTPLTIIRGEADVALRASQRSSDDDRETLQRMRAAADHSARIVDDLLFVARQESGEVRIRPETVDLAQLLQDTLAGSRALRDGNKTLDLQLAVGEAVLSADPGRIRQVLTILLENALCYGGQRVTVRLDSAPDGYAVILSDDGAGLTEDELEHVFERFFRGSNAALRYDGGAGLGLPVAKAIVEAHGGKITLISAAGEGVTARFTLPGRPRLAAAS
ncbi:MAG: HAMP domain-containing sensor histidine kinase [Rhodospirillales bacterium]